MTSTDDPTLPRPEQHSPQRAAQRHARDWRSYLLAMVSVAVTLAALELALAWRLPFTHAVWPSTFDPAVGRVFKPGAEVRWTNWLDWAVVQRANSLGFPDREPPVMPKPADTFRIAILGDSFVEALQVPLAQKLHIQLETILAARHPGRRFETIAFGQSSAGTTTELAQYERYARTFDPDLVVVLFVHNDFSDDSPLVHATVYGWHPDHVPWPMLVRDADGGFRRIPPAADAAKFTIDPGPRPRIAYGVRHWVKWSRLGQWAFTHADRYWGWSGARQRGLETARVARLREEPRFAAQLEGWRHPDDIPPHEMLFAREVPPLFEEAEAATDHAFGLLAAARASDDFTLLIAAIPPCSATPWYRRHLREIVDRGLLVRLERIAARHAIPVLDLAPAFARASGPTEWAHDSHWNALGHRTAAEAIADWIDANVADRSGAR